MYSLAVFSLAVVASAAFPYHGEQAKPVVLPSGHLADTHEVAAAKNAHLGALHGASAHGAHYDAHHDAHHDAHDSHAAIHGADIKYHGPQAVPKVLPDGHIADTHEVSAAKHAHLAAISEAKAHGHAAGHDDGSYHEAAGHGAAHHDAAVHHHDAAAYHHAAGAGYHGPLAKPVVLPSGHLADTHDVAAAKGAHLGALAQASHAHH